MSEPTLSLQPFIPNWFFPQQAFPFMPQAGLYPFIWPTFQPSPELLSASVLQSSIIDHHNELIKQQNLLKSAPQLDEKPSKRSRSLKKVSSRQSSVSLKQELESASIEVLQSQPQPQSHSQTQLIKQEQEQQQQQHEQDDEGDETDSSQQSDSHSPQSPTLKEEYNQSETEAANVLTSIGNQQRRPGTFLCKETNLYHCHLCPYTSHWRSNVIRHKRKHTQEKPYSCQHCQRAFVNSTNRKKHQETCKVARAAATLLAGFNQAAQLGSTFTPVQSS